MRRFTQANFFSCQLAAVHETVAALPVYFEAKRLSSCQIDDELELGRLYHRQVGWLGAFENAAGVDANLAKNIGRSVP